MRWRLCSAHIDHYYYFTEEIYDTWTMTSEWASERVRERESEREEKKKRRRHIMRNKIYWLESNFRRIELCNGIYLQQPKRTRTNNNHPQIRGEKELITRRIYWIKCSQTNTFNVKTYGNCSKTNSRRVNASINIVVIFVIFPIFNINYNSMRHLAVTLLRCEIVNKILDTFCHE